MKSHLARIRFILIRLCLVALGVTWLDLQAQLPPFPKAKAGISPAPLIGVPPPRIATNVSLLWNYPATSMPIRFEVQHHTTAYYTFRNTVDTNAPVEHWIMWAIPESGWSVLAYTTNKFLVTPIRPIRSHLFRVRAQDTSTGLVSEWAGK